MATLSCVNTDDLDYRDFVVEGKRLSKELKKQGAELVIALTHMRLPNDITLAKEVEDIDIISFAENDKENKEIL